MPFNITQPGLSHRNLPFSFAHVWRFWRQLPAEQPAPKVIRLSAERLSRPLVESGLLSAFGTNMGADQV